MTLTTPETPTRKRKAPEEPMTFEQIAERKLTERLTAYRSLVARAASGEQLPEADLEQATELLLFLGLPDFAWRRDIVGKADFDAATKAEADARSQRPGNAKRLEDITARLKTLEAESAALRAERHRIDGMADNSLVAAMSRQNELKSLHPHVLLPLEDALRFRLEQQQRRRSGPMSQGGVS